MNLRATAAPIDERHLYDVLSQYPTGVVAVTGISGSGEPLAMIVGTFTSVSRDPPLVGFLPTRASNSYQRLQECEYLCFNVLSHAQEHLCRRLSAKDADDKLQDVDWSPGITGAPILDGCVAWAETRVVSIREAGDHDFVMAEVLAFDAPHPVLPLLYFQGSFGKFHSSSFVMPYETALLPTISEIERHRGTLERLAHDLGREVVVFAPVADEIVIAASAGTEPNSSTSVVGRRFPHAPPFGSLLIDESDFDEWYARLKDAAPRRAVWKEKVEIAHRRGWSVALSSDEHPSLDRLIEEFSRGPQTPRLQRSLLGVMRQLGADYEPDDERLKKDSSIRMLSVPVMHSNAATDFLISVHSISDPISGAALPDFIARMKAAASELESLDG